MNIPLGSLPTAYKLVGSLPTAYNGLRDYFMRNYLCEVGSIPTDYLALRGRVYRMKSVLFSFIFKGFAFRFFFVARPSRKERCFFSDIFFALRFF